MSRTLTLLGLVALLAVAGCTRQAPAISPQEQVPAAMREDAGAPDDADADDADDAAEPTGEAHRFVAVDLDFSEAPSTIEAGTATFELVNEGNLPHDVAIEELADLVVVHADGGQTETGNVTLEPGEYTYYCDIPGHRAAGMEGTFTVDG